MPANIYQPEDPNPGLTPLPEGQAPTQGFQALSGLGGEMDTLAYRLARARDTTVMMGAKTQLLQAHNALSNQYSQDTDFKNAPAGFATDWGQASNSIVGQASNELSAPAQAELRHTQAVLAISGQNSVQNAAFSREAQTNIANWQTQAPLLTQAFVDAGSPAERDAIQSHAHASIQALSQAGWVNPEAAGKELNAWNQGAEEAYVAKLMQTSPAAAVAMLADPNQLGSIPAARRIALQNGAAAQVDETGQLKLGLLAKQNPPAAIAAMGRIAPGDTASIAQVFDHGVIAQESGGNPGLISSAGALGLAQVMPDTARAAAARMGLSNVASLDDEELKVKLLGDPALNRSLGLNEFSRLVDHYGGYLPAAMAAYNAGEGNAKTPRADAWLKEATDKFGNDPTPAQFASVIPIKETHDYIGAVYGHLGAPMDNFGLTGNAALRGQSQALDIGRQEQAQQQRTLNEGAALARSSDPVTQVLQDGYAVDPERLQAYRQTQAMAAAGGSAEAAQELRRVDMAIAQGPIMRAAYQMPPSQLAATIAGEQQRLSQSPDVSGFEIARLKTLTTVQSAVDAAKSSNTIGLAERQGLFRATPIDFSQSGTPAFSDALAARGPQTLQAAGAYDGNIVPFKPEEVAQAKTALGQMGPADKAGLFASMAANFKDPRVYEAAVKQLAGDRLEATAGVLGGQDPALAEKILAGGEMLRDKGVEAKIEPVRTAITNALPVGLYPNIQTNSDVAGAAAAVYAANKGAAHALIDPNDAAGIKSAIEEVTGPQVAINGRMTPIPKPFAAGAVQHALANLSADDLKPLGGVQPGVDPAWLGAHAQLMPLRLGGSDYQVLVNGQRVLAADGRNLQVNLGDFAARQKARLDAAAKKTPAGATGADPMAQFGGGLQ